MSHEEAGAPPALGRTTRKRALDVLRIGFLVLVLAPMWPFPDRIPTGPQARAAHRRRVWALGVVCVLWLVLQYVAVTEVFTIPVEPGNGRPYP